MSTISGNFTLTALIDGTTIESVLYNFGAPLIQFYTPGTETPTPDFEDMEANEQPLIAPVVRDQTTGSVLSDRLADSTWKYNGVELAFGSNNLSTNEGMEGVFERIPAGSVTIGSHTYNNVPCLRVKKNLVAIGNYDNDRITYSGTIEISGTPITVNEIGIDVTITETSRNKYVVLVDSGGDSWIDDETDEVTLTCTVYNSGQAVSDYSGFSFQWINKGAGEGGSDENLGTARTQKVTRDMVDGSALIGVKVKNGSDEVGYGFATVRDRTDPYYAILTVSGIAGEHMRKGETAVFTPVVYRKNSNETFAGLVTSWTFYTYDSSGNAFNLTGNSSNAVTEPTLSVSYTDAQNAGYRMYIVANGSYS